MSFFQPPMVAVDGQISWLSRTVGGVLFVKQHDVFFQRPTATVDGL